MRDFYREPVFYYVLAPLLIGLWPLLVWFLYLPAAQRSYEAEKTGLSEAQGAILDILKLDPDRLAIADPNDSQLGKFSYLEAIDTAANLSNISPASRNYTSGQTHEVQGKRTQGARLYLEDVRIAQVAKFLTSIQSTWVNLTCDRINLDKQDDMPDQWDVDIDFTYTY